MNEDKLLEQLADVARRRGVDEPDPRWDELAAGRLGDDERHRLLAEDPDSDRKVTAFEPLSNDFKDGIKAQIGASVAANAAVPDIPAPGKSRSPWYGALAASLLAAIAVLTLLPRGGDAPPLPGYSSTLRGGAVMRSEGEGPAVLQPGERIELILTPATRVDTPLAARAFVSVDERLEAIDLPAPEWSPFGAARIVATLGEDLNLPAGDSVLIVAVGSPGALPGESGVAQRLDGPAPADTPWQMLQFPLRLESP